MDERPPEDSPAGGDEAAAVPERLLKWLTFGGVLLVGLVFAYGLPGMLNWPLATLVLEKPGAIRAATAVVLPTASPGALTAVVSPTATTAPTPAPTATIRPIRLVVGNTDGDGVSLRRTPSLGDRLVAWQDGAVMEVVGPDQTGDGLTWRHVRDPKGNTGFVPAQYLVPATN